MWKKIAFALVAALVMTSILGLNPVNAQKKVEGEGTLIAQGDGLAALHGRGEVHATGNGILWVRVRGEATVEVHGYGEKRTFESGWTEYLGFHGSADIVGSGDAVIAVLLSGADIRLTATGRGRAVLWGEGTYQTGPDEPLRSWGKNFKPIHFGAP